LNSGEQPDANTDVTITDADETHRSSGKWEWWRTTRKTTNERREGRCDALARDELANENTRENWHIQVSLPGLVSSGHIPSLTPKPVVGIPKLT